MTNPAREALSRAVNKAIANGAPIYENQPANNPPTNPPTGALTMTTISPYLGHALRRIATGYSVDCRIIAGREYWFLWHHSGACTPMISRTAAKGAYLRLAMQSLHTTNA